MSKLPHAAIPGCHWFPSLLMKLVTLGYLRKRGWGYLNLGKIYIPFYLSFVLLASFPILGLLELALPVVSFQSLCPTVRRLCFHWSSTGHLQNTMGINFMLDKKRTLYLRGPNHGSSICYFYLVMHYSLHPTQPYNYTNIYLRQVYFPGLLIVTNLLLFIKKKQTPTMCHFSLQILYRCSYLQPGLYHLVLRCQGLHLLVKVLD